MVYDASGQFNTACNQVLMIHIPVYQGLFKMAIRERTPTMPTCAKIATDGKVRLLFAKDCKECVSNGDDEASTNAKQPEPTL